ncbi:MAG: ATP-dependent DNA ligase [Myxococcota bacterium]|nr:ATP-dependent DNA ligase [Myxococcota bacterium]
MDPTGVPAHGEHPAVVTRDQVPSAPPGARELVIADKKATLALLAQRGCIGLHAWLARRDRLDHPDRLLLELEAPRGGGATALREGARRCRDLLDALGLPAFLGTSGTEGLHVVVPLDREAGFDEVRAFARDVATRLAERHSDVLTTASADAAGRGRVRLDVERNAWGRTAIAPYAVRARPEAPVATPLDWGELDHASPRAWTLSDLAGRLEGRGDPWAGIGRHASGLEGARRRLARLVAD